MDVSADESLMLYKAEKSLVEVLFIFRPTEHFIEEGNGNPLQYF